MPGREQLYWRPVIVRGGGGGVGRKENDHHYHLSDTLFYLLTSCDFGGAVVGKMIYELISVKKDLVIYIF